MQERKKQQVLLIGHVLVDKPGAHSCFVGYVLDRGGGVVADPREERDGGLYQLSTSLGNQLGIIDETFYFHRVLR